MGERVAVALKRDTLRDRVGAMDLKRPGEGHGRGEQRFLSSVVTKSEVRLLAAPPWGRCDRAAT